LIGELRCSNVIARRDVRARARSARRRPLRRAVQRFIDGFWACSRRPIRWSLLFSGHPIGSMPSSVE